ncbi:MAG: redoxin domain-containing protein [Chitinophagaceae bacterium]
MKRVLTCCFLIFPGFLFGQFQIEAKLKGFEDGTVFYIKDIEADQVLDSAVLNKGRFIIKGQFDDTPRSLWLYTQTPKSSFFYCNLFMGNDRVTVEGSAKDMPYFLKIKGSAIHDIYQILNSKTGRLFQSRDSLVSVAMPLLMKNENQDRQDSLWKIIRAIDDTVQLITHQFIRQHINSYAGVRQLNYARFQFDTTTLRQLYNQLQEPFSESRYARTIATFLKVGSPLKTGDLSRDFTAIDSSGKQHALTDYRGKYVLLNFTTTYCGPCILSKDEMKKAASLYTDRLTVLGFNADPSRETWLKGLIRDQPTWPVVWDGQSEHSEVILKYGVQGYPTYILLDPKGVIVHRWSGYGEGTILAALQKKLPPENLQ